MNRQIKGLLYFYLTNMRYSIIIFWSILSAIIALSLVIGYFLKDLDGVMNVTITIPIYFYVGIIGQIIVKNWMPFMIKIGATRKNIFFSIAIFFTGLSFAFSFLGMLMQEILTPLIKKLGMNNFSFFHIAYFVDEAWYSRLLIDTSISLLLFSISFLIGLLLYRYGLIVGLSFIGLLLLISMLGLFQGWIVEFFLDIVTNINLIFFVKVTVLSIGIYCLTWILLRRATTISTR